MHWLLFIHKIIFSSTCFEPQVLTFRRIQLYTCSIWYCHSLWKFLVACRYTAWVRTDCGGKVVGGCQYLPSPLWGGKLYCTHPFIVNTYRHLSIATYFIDYYTKLCFRGVAREYYCGPSYDDHVAIGSLISQFITVYECWCYWNWICGCAKADHTNAQKTCREATCVLYLSPVCGQTECWPKS